MSNRALSGQQFADSITTFQHPIADRYRTDPAFDGGGCHETAAAYTEHARSHGLSASTMHVEGPHGNTDDHAVTLVHTGRGSHVVDWTARQSGEDHPVPLVYKPQGKNALHEGAQRPMRTPPG